MEISEKRKTKISKNFIGPKKEVKIYALCKECGEKSFDYSNLKRGITVYKGKCPACNKTKILIPMSDWKGLGD